MFYEIKPFIRMLVMKKIQPICFGYPMTQLRR